MNTDGNTYVLGKRDRAIPEELRQIKELKLRISKSGLERFEDLANFPNLIELGIFDYRSTSFAPLNPLRALRRLSIVHFPRVTDLEPLARLSGLEELTLETLPSGDASGKHQVVASFRPLAPLKKLRVLRLAGVRAEDNDLSPLDGLKALQELALGNLFPQQQFARLARELPHVRCVFLAPFLRLEGHICRKCGDEKVMLTGSDVPNPKVVCPVCHRKKFEANVAHFEQLKRGPSEPNATADGCRDLGCS